MRRNEMATRIAQKAGTQMVLEGRHHNLDWADMAVACETAVAIVIAACTEMAQPSDKVRFATEIANTMTEHAHQRVVTLLTLTGAKHDG